MLNDQVQVSGTSYDISISSTSTRSVFYLFLEEKTLVSNLSIEVGKFFVSYFPDELDVEVVSNSHGEKLECACLE